MQIHDIHQWLPGAGAGVTVSNSLVGTVFPFGVINILE